LCVDYFPSLRFLSVRLLIIAFFTASLEQLRDCRYGILAWTCVYCILWISGSTRRLLLRGSLSSSHFESYVSLYLFNPPSVGAMHLYTPSQLPSLLRATRSNSSMILGTSITRIHIVPKTRMCGRKAGARVILRGVSVGFDFFFLFMGLVLGDADATFLFRLWWIFVYE
jgi:hypothetical protein